MKILYGAKLHTELFTLDIGQVNISTTMSVYAWAGNTGYDNLRIGSTIASIMPDFPNQPKGTVILIQ